MNWAYILSLFIILGFIAWIVVLFCKSFFSELPWADNRPVRKAAKNPVENPKWKPSPELIIRVLELAGGKLDDCPEDVKHHVKKIKERYSVLKLSLDFESAAFFARLEWLESYMNQKD
jgi:hypothetical protein